MHFADLGTNNSSFPSIQLLRSDVPQARASRSSAPSRNPTLARIFLAWYRPRPVLSNLHTTLFVLFHFPLPSFRLFLHELATAKCMLHAQQFASQVKKSTCAFLLTGLELPALMHPSCINA